MKRANFKFSDDTEARLHGLTETLGRDRTDIVRMGLRLVGRAVDAARSGRRLAVVEPDGRVVELDGEWTELRPVTA